MKMRGKRGLGPVVIEPGEAARVLERYAARKAETHPVPTVEPIPNRREAAILRRQQAKPEPIDYAHRSLYARAETFEVIRKLAFEKGTSAQAIYREGLFLVLQRYGALDGKSLDDM